MLKIIIFSFFVACFFVYVTCFGGIIIANGEWRVLNIRRCPNYDQYPIDYQVRRKKVNRTADGFDMYIYLNETIDHTYGVYVDVCVYVDGGCKPYQTVIDDNFERFLMKHAKENYYNAMNKFGLVPPYFPVKPGNFGCNDYTFDYSVFPKAGVIGKYSAFGYLVKDNERMACVEIAIDFIVNEGEDFYNM